MSLLNANAAAVLSELGLSEEDGHPLPKSTVKPKKPPSLGTQQSAPRVFNPGKTNKEPFWYALFYIPFLNIEAPFISRTRHYDAEKVRVGV